MIKTSSQAIESKEKMLEIIQNGENQNGYISVCVCVC